ncbi:MAG TPA: hypothetical protein VNN81_08505 [Bradyrhizobium sp.]|nr:hypothetical protein [Bradyrhizobium sp.]
MTQVGASGVTRLFMVMKGELGLAKLRYRCMEQHTFAALESQGSPVTHLMPSPLIVVK